jgi:hypothetical protein
MRQQTRLPGRPTLYVTSPSLSCPRKSWWLMCDRTKASWDQSWLDNVNISGKGHFLTLIKNKVGFWPWAHNNNCMIETARARLRAGHAGVGAHLASFKLSDSPLCSCGSPKTTEHLLLYCPQHASACTQLANTLTRGPFLFPIQNLIVDAVATFLSATNTLHLLWATIQPVWLNSTWLALIKSNWLNHVIKSIDFL